MVRVDSQKHIDFSLTSPFGGGRPGRVKRKNMRAAAKKAAGGDGDEEDEEWSMKSSTMGPTSPSDIPILCQLDWFSSAYIILKKF